LSGHLQNQNPILILSLQLTWRKPHDVGPAGCYTTGAMDGPAHALRTFEGTGGVCLRADAWGDPVRPPVVFLHGGGQTRGAWGDTAQAVARAGYYAVSVDHRGHGESDWAPDGDYAAATMAQDLRRIIAALGAPPVTVGASLGGLVSLLVEGEDGGGALRALVVVDIAPRMEVDGVERILGFMRSRPDGFGSVEEAAQAVAEYLPHRPPPRDLSGLERNLRRTPDGRYVWHWDPRFLEHATAIGITEGQRQRFDDAARRIRVPTLLVRGRMSEVVSEEGVREFLDAVPHAEHVDVSKAGHMVAGDRNDAFTEAVLEFLAQLR
jgi:pimeloyl-ACP methyl ester carboxylesterase